MDALNWSHMLVMRLLDSSVRARLAQIIRTDRSSRATWFSLDNSQTPATTGHLIKTPLGLYRKCDKLSQVRVHQMGLSD